MDGTTKGAAREPLASLQSQVTRLYRSGQADEAWALASASRGKYPQRAMHALWMADLRCRIWDDPEGALDELTRAHREEGCWWAQSLLHAQWWFEEWAKRPAFERLGTRFSTLITECERARAIAQAQVRPAPPAVFLPESGPRRGLLWVFHGRTGRLPTSVRPWVKPATAAGFVVAAVRGTELSSSDNTFDWAAPRRVLTDVWRVRTELVETLHGLPEVAAGLSRGARLAMGFSLAGDFAAAGFLALCPVIRDRNEIEGKIPGAATRRTRGVIWFGEWDWARERTQAFAGRLMRGGVQIEIEVMNGVEHGYPDDFPSRLRRALEFVGRAGGRDGPAG